MVVTGLGAVTPIGNDARATWRAAVAGESGVDWIRAFDASGFPVRIAAEVKDFDASAVASPKEVRKLERNVLLALGAAREAVGDAGLDGVYEPGRVGILFGTAIGGLIGIMEQAEVLRDRGADRVSPIVHPERPAGRRERPARDLARLPRAELRAGLGVRDGVALRSARRRR